MGFLDGLKQFLAIEPMQVRTVDPFVDAPTFEAQLRAIQSQARPWRAPSIREALGVPAIQRAVTLVANVTGSLSMQGFDSGAVMELTPRLIARPNPFETPRDTYRDMAYSMASRGETVLWIAARDTLGRALSLVQVPLPELNVEANPRNRLFPIYTWGDVRGTRYSAANPTGEFVHITYLREPGALRGVGPLQLAGAATSVSVEAQEFAANFYAEGGKPSVNLHSEIELEDNEAKALREQWVTTPSNMPQVTSGPLELREVKLNEQGGQMLMARDYQNGDAARMFGIPGSLMEYSTPGSSLTYQNLAEVWTQFVRGCLAPNYLEPIEQALTDLLPRSQTARFYVDGLLRADVKTRFEVYGIGIDKGIFDPEYAQRLENIIPGSVEVAPVPAAAPAAVPSSLPQMRSSGPVRCEGMRLLRGRLTTCGKLLAEAGPFVGTCPRCARVYAPPVPVKPAVSEEVLAMRSLAASVVQLASRVPEQPIVNVTMPEQPAPVTNVTVQPTPVQVSAPITVTMPEPPVETPKPAPHLTRLVYDDNGRLEAIADEAAS